MPKKKKNNKKKNKRLQEATSSAATKPPPASAIGFSASTSDGAKAQFARRAWAIQRTNEQLEERQVGPFKVPTAYSLALNAVLR